MRIIVLLPLVRMVEPVWMIMVATHASAVISGLERTVQVSIVLTLDGYTCQGTDQWFSENCTGIYNTNIRWLHMSVY